MICEFQKKDYVISTNKRKLQIKTVHRFLTHSYWSQGISIEKVRKSIRHSLCFGVYYKSKQIGFARVITDRVRFGYIADVFIVEEYRGKGLSKWLMKCIMEHRELKNIQAWMLATRDAHGLYSQFGFEPLAEPKKYMRKENYQFKFGG